MPKKREISDDTGLSNQKSTRPQLRQTDIPRITVERALQVPRALADQYAGQPVSPLNIAAALEMSPTSSNFPTLCGASSAYGLTGGTARSPRISLTLLGRRIVLPTEEGDDRDAIVEAVLTPAIERRFLEHYDGSPLPVAKIAQNVLETWGVPANAAERSYETIRENAQFANLITVVKGKECIDLSRVQPPETKTESEPPTATDLPAPDADIVAEPTDGDETSAIGPSIRPSTNRVFIAHGRDLTVASQLKELLEVVGLEPVIAIDEEATSKPLSEKVLGDLLSCSAGIIHIRPEPLLSDAADQEHMVLNQNVLIEIGAALAHFRDRFILLVEEGTELPSNIAGLYQVRYSGNELGHSASVRVLRALKQFDDAP